MIARVLLCACSVAAMPAVAQVFGPAPSGNPRAIAETVIAKDNYPCPRIETAYRNPGGGIWALCSNKEDYLVFSLDGRIVAMRCRLARRLAVATCRQS